MAMMQAPDDQDGLMTDINTTPLIDVMLVLLIMLIITIPVQTHSVVMDMPVSAVTPPQDPAPVVSIRIGADGTVRWNEEALPDQSLLEARLIQAAAQKPQPEIHVRPDPDGAYGPVAQVMATIQRLGLQRIGIIGVH